MARIIGIGLLLIIYVSGCLCGDVCYEANGNAVHQFYCDSGCCGNFNDGYCCWDAGAIIGAVVGIFFFLVIVAAVAVCCYMQYQARKKKRVQQITVTQVDYRGQGAGPPTQSTGIGGQPQYYHPYGAPTMYQDPAYPPGYAAPKGADYAMPLSVIPYHETQPVNQGGFQNTPPMSSAATNQNQPPRAGASNITATAPGAPPHTMAAPPPPTGSGGRNNPFRLNSLPPLPPVTANPGVRTGTAAPADTGLPTIS